mmetsp:Transcript_7977/g.18650  ORF Transcript_7977/g.18650 Transcript_7977/m.18650 type:complete len:201 (-) Transcript_7977:51-653(-)
MPVYVRPEAQVTVTRKVGERSEHLHAKFRGAEVAAAEEQHVWQSLASLDFNNTRPHHYKAPEKYGVMAGRMKSRGVVMPKPFLATSTSAATHTVDSETTMRVYSRPLRQAPCEVALQQGSQFRRKKPAKWAPKDLLREEKKRVQALPKLEQVDPPVMRINMPSYTGHEPKSPKNLNGPFRPSADTTSGRANLEGLGMLLS